MQHGEQNRCRGCPAELFDEPDAAEHGDVQRDDPRVRLPEQFAGGRQPIGRREKRRDELHHAAHGPDQQNPSPVDEREITEETLADDRSAQKAERSCADHQHEDAVHQCEDAVVRDEEEHETGARGGLRALVERHRRLAFGLHALGANHRHDIQQAGGDVLEPIEQQHRTPVPTEHENAHDRQEAVDEGAENAGGGVTHTG